MPLFNISAESVSTVLLGIENFSWLQARDTFAVRFKFLDSSSSSSSCHADK
jgi:hypothetical protein